MEMIVFTLAPGVATQVCLRAVWCSYIDIESEKKNSKMLSVTKAKKTEPFTSPKGKKIRKSPTAADEDLWFDTIKVGD